MKGQPVRPDAPSAGTERAADLLSLSYEPMFVWRLEGPIESWNAGAERLYGFSPDEALGPVDNHRSQIMAPTRKSMDTNESAVFS
jgi:PAS domain-containing protein